jgi:hypothetical protein
MEDDYLTSHPIFTVAAVMSLFSLRWYFSSTIVVGRTSSEEGHVIWGTIFSDRFSSLFPHEVRDRLFQQME